ncbi:MAG: hypothetical protein JWN95_956 [Frankiales bacterium]|nr:hypothetical protein [Frankiales bacterium]
MNHSLRIIGTALLWGAGGALAAWLITWPLRRRSQAGLLVSITLVGTGSSVAAVFGNTRAMFLATDDGYVTVVVAVVAGVLAAGAAALAGRTFARDKKALLLAIGALREERVPTDDGRRLSGELESLRRDLDLTARTLAESRERERALESSRRELFAWVSHDLRTPLAGLRAMAEALEDGLASSPERYHKQIRIEVDRLTGMVDDLFEISRLQSGAPRPRIERVNLTDLVSDCLAALEPVAVLHGVQLVGHATTDIMAEVSGNGSELNRAVTNLIVNAIRHTVSGGAVTIALTTSPVDGAAAGSVGGASQLAKLTVRDQCGGIAEVDLARVFDVGFRGEPARTPQANLGAGAGMGLAITRGILAAHGGTIDVRNLAGGCAFTVTLPASS